MSRRLPPTASVAHPGAGARLYSPSAVRNAPPLCDLLDRVAPKTGSALELASGSGEHVIAFAARLPGLSWQPTEIDDARRASVDAHVAAAALRNVAPALILDATAPGWGAAHGRRDLIVLVNLLHLISWPETRTLIGEVATALVPGGRFVIYGPFLRDGALTSDGDAAFHASLTAADPEIGYKNDVDIRAALKAAGLEPREAVEMPANNLTLIAEKPTV